VETLKGLPEGILETICHQLEPSTSETTSLPKHEENKTVLALSKVCKTWYSCVTTYAALFQDITFDFLSEGSILIVRIFLKWPEGTEAPIYAFADLSYSPVDALLELFAKFRPHIWHVVHSEHSDELNGYCSYFYPSTLHLPFFSDNSVFFSDNSNTYPGKGPPLFRDHTPSF
jgi:hypothetical protein